MAFADGEMGMACRSCGSDKQKEFSAEMVIHFPGREGFDKPAVPVLTQVMVCFTCGCTLFTISETEKRLLEEGAAAA